MKVLTFGELLLRLSSPGYNRLFQTNQLESTFCGSEANVAVSLANLGVDVCYLTKLPQNDIAKAAVNSLRYFGVDTSRIIYGTGRMGLYYLEKGISQRSSRVIYDRAYSSFSMSKIIDYNWDKIFDGIDLFHWSGINPSLSDEMALICEEACKVAKEKGIIIICDLNYRKNLWSTDNAQKTMDKMLRYVDVCVGNEEDSENALGLKVPDTNVENAVLHKEGYVKIAEEICRKYNINLIAFTMRKSYSANYNGWSGMIYDNHFKENYFSKEYNISIVDRVGAGDSFVAGLIYGIVNKMNIKDCLNFATASSCLKHSIEGDYNRTSISEVMNLINSKGNGRIER